MVEQSALATNNQAIEVELYQIKDRIDRFLSPALDRLDMFMEGGIGTSFIVLFYKPQKDPL